MIINPKMIINNSIESIEVNRKAQDFEQAAKKGNIRLMQSILRSIPSLEILRDRIIHGNIDYAFQVAARNGHVSVLEYLLRLTPNKEKREAMIHKRRERSISFGSA